MKTSGFAIALWAMTAGSAFAAPASTSTSESVSILPGGNSKDPVSIEADQLVYSDRDGKATYIGNVVLIQGETKLNCTSMTLFIDKGGAAPSPTPSAKAGEAPPPGGSSSQLRHMDCVGPVTVVSKTQTATGDSAMYDKPQNKVWIIGNVTLSDGPNVTKGDKLTYDLSSGQAHVETKTSAGKPSRVWSQFVPGSDNSTVSASASPSAKPTPKPSKSGAPKP